MQNVNDGFFAVVLVGIYAIAALGYALWKLRRQRKHYQSRVQIWNKLLDQKNASIEKLDNQVARYKKVNGDLNSEKNEWSCMAHEQLARSITKDGDRVIEINEGIAREDKLKRSNASLQGWCRRYRRDIRELTYAIDTRY